MKNMNVHNHILTLPVEASIATSAYETDFIKHGKKIHHIRLQLECIVN